MFSRSAMVRLARWIRFEAGFSDFINNSTRLPKMGSRGIYGLAKPQSSPTNQSKLSALTEQSRKPVSLHSLMRKYREQRPITMVTAHDSPSASIVDEANVDMILVGDSLSMTVLGHRNTVSVTMDTMIHHCKAVAGGTARSFIVADMPFGSYLTPMDAVPNAVRF